MKPGATIFLQIVIVFIGAASLGFLLWEPHVEGRNANATPFEIYFKDPVLAYAYIASVPYFMALHQGFKVLGCARRGVAFSPGAVKALRIIRRCALCIIGFVVVSLVFLPFGDPEDRPPGIVMRVVITFGCAVVVSAAVVVERLLQDAVDLKSGNDLTA